MRINVIDFNDTTYVIDLNKKTTSYTVKALVPVRSGPNTGEVHEEYIGHFITLEGSIEKIIKCILADTTGVFSLREYLDEYKKVFQSVEKSIHEQIPNLR